LPRPRAAPFVTFFGLLFVFVVAVVEAVVVTPVVGATVVVIGHGPSVS
jgi:hypothetical protein